MDDPVQFQLEAYNAGDIDAFVACYARDVVTTDGNGTTLMEGTRAFRSAYGQIFEAHRDLHADILSRQIAGGWTVDHERVSKGGEVLEMLVAYRVEQGLIQRVIMLR